MLLVCDNVKFPCICCENGPENKQLNASNGGHRADGDGGSCGSKDVGSGDNNGSRAGGYAMVAVQIRRGGAMVRAMVIVEEEIATIYGSVDQMRQVVVKRMVVVEEEMEMRWRWCGTVDRRSRCMHVKGEK